MKMLSLVTRNDNYCKNENVVYPEASWIYWSNWVEVKVERELKLTHIDIANWVAFVSSVFEIACKITIIIKNKRKNNAF